MKRRLLLIGLAAGGLMLSGSASAQTNYVGEVRLFGFNFCPVGWLPADGQTLPISQYVPLFSLYGTTYGGDGTKTFKLPDLQGRAPAGVSATESWGTAYGSINPAPGPAKGRFLSMTWCVAYLGVFPPRN
jgi:microcystin-dependent protein